ncbi:sugar kinase [Teredinibacter sp. KSP-S5-2]|uniref:sugar kinase n=1 Tax=Teredinibacter sp. KSP-S5-2 TaxID=3034506 RepID=UPI002934DA9F|nr:sugar kinase [Teredinibacter sp. KSP-S5-2]WNO08501.1 sugar kinase [Teredinibacter sp. KSP-S5-2]
MSGKLRIGFLGECMLELSDGRSDIQYGGDTLNAAVYFSRLNKKSIFNCYYLTALGDDDLSVQMIAAWEKENISTQYVDRLPGKLPGLYMIKTNDQGERSFYFWRNDSAAKAYLSTDTFSNVIINKQLDVLYLSGISLGILPTGDKKKLLKLLKEFKNNGGIIAFDNNYRPQLWKAEEAELYYSQILGMVDIALLTEEDELAVHGFHDSEELMSFYQKSAVPEVVIKRGAEACVIICNKTIEVVDGVAVPQENVVDTTAAGDSFGAAYLYYRLHGKNTEEAAKTAHLLASTVIQEHGAVIPVEKMPVFLP